MELYYLTLVNKRYLDICVNTFFFFNLNVTLHRTERFKTLTPLCCAGVERKNPAYKETNS